MPLFWVSLAFISGLAIAALIPLSSGVWLALGLAPLFLVGVPRLLGWAAGRLPIRIEQFLNLVDNLASRTLLLLSISAACLGAARYLAAQPQFTPSFIASYNDTGERMAVIGLLVEPPDVRDEYTNLRVQAEQIRPVDGIEHIEVSGLLLARVPAGGTWHYGDSIVLEGELETPPEDEDFSYQDYLAQRGVYSLMPFAQASLLETGQGNPARAALYSFKDRSLETIYRLFPDPEASLLAGILLGVENGISAELKEAFSETGTRHIIAISGFNITIIAGLLVKLFSSWLGPRRGSFAAAVGIAFYTLLVGAEASVVRAAIMGGLGLLARQVGRRQDGLISLAVTAALMALFNPLVLWDVGFQLSFTATLGLVLYAEPLSAGFTRWATHWLSEERAKKLTGPVGDYFLMTIAAQITSLPVLAYHFHRLSLTAVPASFAVLPAQPAVMLLGGLAVLTGLIWFPIGQLVAFVAWPFAAYTIRAVEWFANLPVGAWTLGNVGLAFVFLYYALLFAITYKWEELKHRGGEMKQSIAFVPLAVVTVLVWNAIFTAPDGKLHITFLDVGMGDAILLQTPDGRYVLIDGGPSANLLSEGLGRRLPLYDHGIDVLVIGGPDEEQVGALPRVLERFPPDEVLWAGSPNLTRDSRFLQAALTEADIPITTAQAGHALDLGRGAKLQVLTANPRGAILLLEWQNFRLLLPLGADFADLEALEYGEQLGQVTALLLAESGFAPLTPPEWLQNLNPSLILLSVEAGNFEGLPSPETMELVQAYSLLRTDSNGWILITTDGVLMWVEVERENQ